MTDPFVCAFCGRSDSPPHKEDVLPKWIAALYPDAYVRITPLKPGPNRKAFTQRNQLGIVTRAACQRCNNGWMSRLETAAKPILLPLFEGERRTLSTDDQRIISEWLIKTVMMYEFTKREYTERFFRTADLSRFFESRAIPADTQVFLAQHRALYRGIKTRDYAFRLKILANAPEAVEFDAYVATLAIDRLALQVFSCHPPDDLKVSLAVRFAIPVDWSRTTIDIWPTAAEARWPPPLAFDEWGFVLFSNRFSALK